MSTKKISELGTINDLTSENLANIYFLATLSNSEALVATKNVNYTILSNAILDNISASVPTLTEFNIVSAKVDQLNIADICATIDFKNIWDPQLTTIFTGYPMSSSITSYILANNLCADLSSLSVLHNDTRTTFASVSANLTEDVLDAILAFNDSGTAEMNALLTNISIDLYGTGIGAYTPGQNYDIVDVCDFLSNHFLSSIIDSPTPIELSTYIKDTLSTGFNFNTLTSSIALTANEEKQLTASIATIANYMPISINSISVQPAYATDVIIIGSHIQYNNKACIYVKNNLTSDITCNFSLSVTHALTSN